MNETIKSLLLIFTPFIIAGIIVGMLWLGAYPLYHDFCVNEGFDYASVHFITLEDTFRCCVSTVSRVKGREQHCVYYGFEEYEVFKKWVEK